METADVAAHPLFVVVDVLTLTRIIKSVVTGQAPVTLELRNTPGKGHMRPARNAMMPVLLRALS